VGTGLTFLGTTFSIANALIDALQARITGTCGVGSAVEEKTVGGAPSPPPSARNRRSDSRDYLR
jgi:hypothetical protein